MTRPVILELAAERFRPGAPVTGAVRWQLDQAPRTGELRLRWDTAGKGDPDHEVVGVAALATLPRLGAAGGAGHPFRGDPAADPAPPLAAVDARRFHLDLPLGPYSFVGKLIELSWSIEVELEGERVRRTLVVAPRARPITL